jgi:Enoyl-CoA hydratase/isomerase
MTEHVKIEIAEGVMTLTLWRPEKKNALTGSMYDTLSNALKQAEADTSVRVVLFQGEGDSFTAGNDLADFASQARGESAVDSPAHRFIETISKASKPLIAAVQAMLSVWARLCSCTVISSISPTTRGSSRPSSISRWFLKLRRAGYCPCGLDIAEHTPCLRWGSQWRRLPHWRVVSQMPWCRRQSCAGGRVTRL